VSPRAKRFRGACHCGGIRFEVELPEGLDHVVRCNCSLCGMRGAVVAFAGLDGVTVTEGADLLASYRFHSEVAEHHFCRRCGIYTHHQRRFDPTQYAVNVACLEGVSPFDFAEVPVIDGRNHPKDTGAAGLSICAVQKIERR
jgi:hypothetical protein